MEPQQLDLLNKYNTNVPRYTSYPTILDWKNPVNEEQWIQILKEEINKKFPIAFYIHIPFCRTLCTFCACNKVITQQYGKAKIYTDHLIQEWELYKQKLDIQSFDIQEIHIGGGTPNYLTPEDLERLMNSITKNNRLSPKKSFSIEIDPRTVTYEHLVTYKKLGFNRISLGIQDFDYEVQKIINRVQSYEKVKEVVDWARELEIESVNFDILYGLPNQTLDSIDLTIKKIELLKPDRIAFYSYAHVPWFSKAQTHHEKFNLPIGAEKINLFYEGSKKLQKLGYQSIGMDHFALKTNSLYKALKEKTMHRNFMGYIDHFVHPMIGLGSSSISDSWRAFNQNKKDIAQYQNHISNNQLPLVKSHLLDKKQIKTRQYILNIMTQLETLIDEDELPEIQKNASEMLKDGLIFFEENLLKVSPTGKNFLRNVASLFDESFTQNQNYDKKFSKSV